MRKKVLLAIICFFIIFSNFALSSVEAVYNASEVQQVHTNNMNQLDEEIRANTTAKENTREINNIKELESNKYIIDDENKIIYRIIPETGVDVFKNNFSIPEDIKVFENENCENEVIDGYIGTGMVLRNETNNEIYKISVIGDFNSDGKITQIELTNLIRHVVGLKDYRLSGYMLRSADVNNDNEVNHIDITLIIRYNVYGELDIEENQEIKSPDIEIVEGTEGNNEWYTSNVKFRVKENEENVDKIDKTTYKISGSKIQEETEIKEDDIISLDEGTYLISAYTYDKNGFKSLATRKTIKIDTTKPNVGQLDMWLNKVNGERYVQGTWTNQNVILQLVNGSDELSGHAKTTYSVKENENIPEGTIENKVLENNGTYTAIVKTEDIAGNSSTKEYIIKIDKSATSNPDIKVISGDKAQNSDWYNGDSVVLQITNEKQIDGASKIFKTTYKIEGINQVEETEIEDGGTITINENGIYTITAYNINEAGQKSDGVSIVVKKDNTIPDAPEIDVTEGTKAEDSDWYINDISLQVKKAEIESYLSPINKITYKIEGTKQAEETEIDDGGTITINENGIYTITVYNYNEAGKKSEGKTVTIKKDDTTLNTPIIDIIAGTKNENSEWYKDNVTLLVKQAEIESDLAPIVKMTYKIEGALQLEETEIENGGSITINRNGIYMITVYNYNEAGKKSEKTITIKRDDTTPNAPGIQVIDGNQSSISDWYISDVTLQVKQTEVAVGLSPINKVTYTIDGATNVPETEIVDEGTIKITSEGISTVKVYNYNEAGTKSPEAIIIIKKDTVEPSKSNINAQDIKATSFTLVSEALDDTSGIIKYEFYLDDKLLSTVESSENKVEVVAENLTSGVHKAYVIVTDAAGNTKKSQIIDVKTERLTESEINYFEFVITKNEITNSSGEIVDSGAVSTISDTSLTPIAKYIMINSTEQNIKGTLEGKLRLVRKDGTVVEEFDYLPNDLIINMSYYSNGSGTNFTHEKQAVFFGINLNSQNVGEGQTVNTNITIPNLQENKFILSDKKQTGTQTYTRATIESISLNGENIPFRIVQE